VPRTHGNLNPGPDCCLLFFLLKTHDPLGHVRLIGLVTSSIKLPPLWSVLRLHCYTSIVSSYSEQHQSITQPTYLVCTVVDTRALCRSAEPVNSDQSSQQAYKSGLSPPGTAESGVEVEDANQQDGFRLRQVLRCFDTIATALAATNTLTRLFSKMFSCLA